MKCTDKEWQHCRVEKMGCKGCYYDELNNLEKANEFANLTFIYGGKIVFTSEQLKCYQKAVEKIIQKNEQLEKYYECERNLLDSYIPKQKIIEELKKLDKDGYWDFLEERDLEKTKQILQKILEV